MHNPLWQYSLSRYRLNGVEALCLEAQDRHGVDVNLLLLAGWLGERGWRLEPAQLAELERAVEPWREAVVLPLRSLRRQWRGMPDRAALREGLKALELRAEGQLQDMLWQCSRRQRYAAGGSTGVNLRLVLDAAAVAAGDARMLADELALALRAPPRTD